MRNSVKVALAVLAFTMGGAVVAQAQATSGSGTLSVSANVLSAITVTGNDLVFGNVAPTQTKTIAAANGGRFDITASPSSQVSVTFDLPADLGDPKVYVDTWTALTNTTNDPVTGASALSTATAAPVSVSATGNAYVWLGGTLHTAGATPGSYSGTVTLNLTYN
ncbi:MAG TPA: DUF4402 domain-containing protein [Gemmatimonadales bacterium]|nr:DUF4402 domain-containing protein [Gemmatimonadales bacterium]